MNRPNDDRLFGVFHWLSGWLEDHAVPVLVLATLLTVAAGALIPELKIKSDLADLLPDYFPSVVRMREIERRLGTQADMVVVVESKDPDANLRFGAKLAEEIRGLRGQVGSVLFRRDRTYFERHALLYLDQADLEKLESRVDRKIREAVARSMDAAFGLDGDDDRATEEEDGPEDEFDARKDDDGPEDEFDARRDRRDGPAGEPSEQSAGEGGIASGDGGVAGASGPESGNDSALLRDIEDILGDEASGEEMERIRERFEKYDIDEYQRTEDGTLVILKVRPLFPPTQLEKATVLTRAIKEIVERLGPSSYAADMKVTFKGDYAEKQAQLKGIRSDIYSSALLIVLLLMGVIAVHFRSARAVPIILVPTIYGIVWTLGLTELVLGHLNIVSSFIFAILMGMGIDFSIHTLARYDEERARGADPRDAVASALRFSGISNVNAALTTISVFLTLLLADFKGFSEFGAIAAMGILLSIVNVFLVFPACIFLGERMIPARYREAPRDPRATVGTTWKPGPVLAGLVLAVSLAAAGYSLWNAPDLQFEYSFSKLNAPVRRKPEVEAPERAGNERRGDRYLEAAGKNHDVAPAVVLTDSLDETRMVYDTFEAILALPDEDAAHPERWTDPLLQPLKERLEDPAGWMVYAKDRLYDDILSIWKFVPEDQADKLAIMGRIAEKIRRKLGSFAADDRARMEKLLGYLTVGEVDPTRFPAWVKEQFQDREGRLGRFVVFRAKGAKADYLVSSKLKATFWDLPFDHKTFPVAATYFVLPEVVDTIREDGKLTVALGLAAITLLLVIQFRRGQYVVAILVPLVLGASTLAGFLYVTGMKLNYFNVVVIPLLLGMGVDNGIHLFSRFLEEGTGAFTKVMRHTGGAMFLTTLTTCIGFGGLWVANHSGLHSLATTAIAGMSACLLASLFTLPAVVILMERFGLLAPPR